MIILFEQKSLAKKGFSTKDLLENEKAASYSSSLKKQQLSLVDRIEREALGGEELEIRYQFTVAVNGVATVVPYGRIEQILAVDGVADVYLEERYELDATGPAGYGDCGRDGRLLQRMGGRLHRRGQPHCHHRHGP